MSSPAPVSHFSTSHCLLTRASTVCSSSRSTPGYLGSPIPRSHPDSDGHRRSRLVGTQLTAARLFDGFCNFALDLAMRGLLVHARKQLRRSALPDGRGDHSGELPPRLVAGRLVALDE